MFFHSHLNLLDLIALTALDERYTYEFTHYEGVQIITKLRFGKKPHRMYTVYTYFLFL